MNCDFLDHLIASNSCWVYAAIILIALLEGLVITTFFVNGTLMIVAAGAFVARGTLDPVETFICIYAGTFVGDGLSYFLSTRLQSISSIKARITKYDKYRAPLAQHPTVFIVLGHLIPNLKGVNALFAAGIVPRRSWLLAESIGAFFGTIFFGIIGALGHYLSVAGYVNPLSFYLGIGAAGFLALLLLKPANSCAIRKPSESSSLLCPKNRNWKRVVFVCYFPFWFFVRKAEGLLRKLPSRTLRKNLAAAFPDVRPGDIFLVRLHARAPWGIWAHSAIALSHQQFCHGFGKYITAHRLEALPIRYAIAHFRVKCSDETAGRAAMIAASMIGKPVALMSREGDTRRFSCASLIFHAYRAAGLGLQDRQFPRVCPDDLMESPKVELVRVVYTEKQRKRIEQAESEQRQAA